MVGVGVFFYLIFELFTDNNLFFQVQNRVYVMFLNLLFPDSDDSCYYVFNKYHFLNVFDYKYGYLFLDRFVVTSFVRDFQDLNREYISVSGGRGLFVDLNVVLVNQVVPVLVSFYNEGFVKGFGNFVKFRYIYRILNVKAGGKVFFEILKFVVRQQRKASIF